MSQNPCAGGGIRPSGGEITRPNWQFHHILSDPPGMNRSLNLRNYLFLNNYQPIARRGIFVAVLISLFK
jgi:hypothetical protein